MSAPGPTLERMKTVTLTARLARLGVEVECQDLREADREWPGGGCHRFLSVEHCIMELFKQPASKVRKSQFSDAAVKGVCGRSRGN
jgi:hypothetical protein